MCLCACAHAPKCVKHGEILLFWVFKVFKTWKLSSVQEPPTHHFPMVDLTKRNTLKETHPPPTNHPTDDLTKHNTWYVLSIDQIIKQNFVR